MPKDEFIHEISWYKCIACGGKRINTMFWINGHFFFIHTCVHCDAPSEEPVD